MRALLAIYGFSLPSITTSNACILDFTYERTPFLDKKQREKMVRALLNFLQKTKKPECQLLFLIIASAIALCILYQPLQEFQSLDPQAVLLPIDPKVIKRFGSPSIVKVGLHIISFPEFDMLKNKFLMDGIIWFEFNPSLISLETLRKFSFEKGEIIKVSEPEIQVIDKQIFARFNFKLQFSSNLDFKRFPIDDHKINLVLTNTYLSPRSVIYDVQISRFTFAPNIFIAGWTIKDATVTSGYSREELDTDDVKREVIHPQALFSIDLKRAGTRHLSAIFLPLFMLFFMGLIGLSLNPATFAGSMVSIATGSLSGMTVYRFVIEGMSPSAGYFMISDQVFVLFLTLGFIVFALTATIAHYQKFNYDFSAIQSIMIVLLYIIALTAWYIILN